MRKLSHQQILNRQAQKLNQKRLPVSVVLNNIRSLYNVGSIFRTADGAGVEKIWLCGITGYPPNNQISKTALGAELRVSWEYQSDIVVVLKELKAQGYQLVLLEQLEESSLYQDFVAQSPTCLIVGNEIEGVSQQILDLCDEAIEIEMAGVKNSLNVSVAFGVAIYHIRQMLIKKDGARG